MALKIYLKIFIIVLSLSPIKGLMPCEPGLCRAQALSSIVEHAEFQWSLACNL